MRIDRVLAPNAGIFTGPGTNTWVMSSDGEVVVIDPGPCHSDHEKAIIENVERAGRPQAILVTHTHSDHAPLANPLGLALSVPVFGYRPGPDFDPDRLIEDGWELTVGLERLQVVHTPGHSDDHVCFLAGRVLFTGDHIMSGSSVMIEDLTDYMASLRRVHELDLDRLYPGHGPELDNPEEVIDWYLAHRLQREQEILDAITGGAASLGEVVEAVYAEVNRDLYPLAIRSVAAHVRKLALEGRAEFAGGPEPDWDEKVSIAQ